MRAGGKHNDLENVGYTRRHHTFFEMLGNFSFGDYFKADAIAFAWDLITKDYGLPKDKLYVTVFREDDDAEELWQKVAGVPKDRIFRLDEKDNFWQMGDTGPCGPCSEIHYDLGPEAAEPGREHEQFPSDAGGRFVEIWNLVFMQFDRDAAGKLTPLPRPSIDTGMGLERVAAVLQGKLSNYETDLIRPIIEHAADLFGTSLPATNPRVDTALRITADHARATAFLIHDGVLPSNEGRGYVLRKIMRRAMRNARMVGVDDPYLYKLTGFVAELMQPAYPEMMESVQRVARVVKDEEHRYATTFLVAEKHVPRRSQIRVAGSAIPGAAAFKLYDTYGLALDEQEDMARERGLTIDREGFEQRDGAAARARPRQLEGRRKGRGRSGLSEAARTGPHEIPGLRRPRGQFPRHRSAGREADRRRGSRRRPGRTGARSDAVLRRGRRPGRRPRRCSTPIPARRSPMSNPPSPACPASPCTASPPSRRSAWATCCAPKWPPRCATPPCATTPPRTCCTPRCARCSARTSNRPAAWSSPAACASTSRTTPPWTAPRSKRSSGS